MKRLVLLLVLLFASTVSAQSQWEYGFFYFFGGAEPSWAWTTNEGTIESDSLEEFWEELTGGTWFGMSGVNVATLSWLGSEGWELVDVEEGTTTTAYYFKRPISE
jgi:hypothetical protein